MNALCSAVPSEQLQHPPSVVVSAPQGGSRRGGPPPLCDPGWTTEKIMGERNPPPESSVVLFRTPEYCFFYFLGGSDRRTQLSSRVGIEHIQSLSSWCKCCVPARGALTPLPPLARTLCDFFFEFFVVAHAKVDIRDQERCRRKRNERQFEAWGRCRTQCQAVVDMALQR